MKIISSLYRYGLLVFLKSLLTTSALAGPEYQELADRMHSCLDSVYLTYASKAKDRESSTPYGIRRNIIDQRIQQLTASTDFEEMQSAFQYLAGVFSLLGDFDEGCEAMYDEIFKAILRQLSEGMLAYLETVRGPSPSKGEVSLAIYQRWKSSLVKTAQSLAPETSKASQIRWLLLNLEVSFKEIKNADTTDKTAAVLHRGISDASRRAQLDPERILCRHARYYFAQQYGDLEEFCLVPKEEGIQCGSIIEFKVGGMLHRFYVKTHLSGFRPEQLGHTDTVDPYEIFVYKLLECLGFGPEVHFFWKNPHDFCIATRDVSHSGQGTESDRPSYTYSKIKEYPELFLTNASGTPEWLSSDSSSRLNPPKQITSEQALDINPAIADGLIQVYWLETILGLCDLTENQGNICFIPQDQTRPPALKVQIVDFGILDRKKEEISFRNFLRSLRREYRTQSVPFIKFSQGWGSFAKIHDGVIRYFLHDGPLEELLQRTDELFSPSTWPLSRFLQCIDEAKAVVDQLVSERGLATDEKWANFEKQVAELRHSVRQFFKDLRSAK
jgi:hypothetical protein